MPMMPTVVPDSDRPVVTYIHRRGNNVRIQLEAVDDLRDARGRTIERGKTLHAHFNKGMFTTNIEKIQDMLEKSYAYEAKEVEKQTVIEERAMTQQLDALMEVATRNPDLAKELRSRLTKMQLAKKVTAKAEETGIGEGSLESTEDEE